MPALSYTTRTLLAILCAALISSFTPNVQARDPGGNPTPPGTYGSGVELSINGNLTLYGLAVPAAQNGGAGVIAPNGSSATYSSSWGNGTETSPVLNLGSFDPTLGQTLFLTGGSLLTFDGDDDNVIAGYLAFRIFQGSPSGAFTEFNLPLNNSAVSGIPGRKRWSSESQTFDLLSGLSAGNYVLAVYLRAPDSGGGVSYSRLSGNNFGATFNLVPEPSSLALVVVSLIGATLFLPLRGRLLFNRRSR